MIPCYKCIVDPICTVACNKLIKEMEFKEFKTKKIFERLLHYDEVLHFYLEDRYSIYIGMNNYEWFVGGNIINKKHLIV